MKKPFDISMRPQIESGEYKVVTADDHPVRICCWDAEEDWPIVALVKDYNKKSDYCYPMMCDTAGVSATKGKQKQLYVITPEPELTPFEEKLLSVIKDYQNVVDDEDSKILKDLAGYLLDVARNELKPKYDATKVDEQLIEKMVNDKFKQFDMVVNPENTKHFYKQGLCDMYKQFAAELDEAFKHKDEVVYNKGYDKGTGDALKDIPRWQTGTPPYKSVWLTRTNHKDGHSTVACETFQNDKWPHEGDLNVLYLDMNKLLLLPIDYGKDNY